MSLPSKKCLFLPPQNELIIFENYPSMKNITSLLSALFLVIGLAQAQDVYVSGNHNNVGKVLKNNTLLYSIADSTTIQLKGIQVADDGTVYGAGYAFGGSSIQGHLWANDSCIFVSDTNTYFDHIVINDNNWTVAGFNNIWQNGEPLYSYSHGDDDECHIHGLAVDPTTGDIYAGGVIVLASDSLAYASVWKNDSLLWMDDTNSSIEGGICFDGGNLYAAGFRVENDSLTYGVIWQNDSIIYQLDNANFGHIATFNGSLYWTGFSMTDSMVNIWQDGEVLYDLPELSGISNLVVNENGVYFTDAQTVYKDGEVLYQPEQCIISDLVVMPNEPEPTFTLTIIADSTDWGYVTGGGMYHYGDTATIEAIANMGCEFLFWNDSITENPRNIIITQDTTFIAHFSQFSYVIETSVSPENTGVVTGGGTYHYGDTILLEAIANDGFAFERWNDSITEHRREVIVTQDSSFVAFFGIRHYTITVESDHPSWGSVIGGGSYYYGDTIQIEAIANLGFEFMNWTDGITENPRTVIVTEDKTFTAHFGIQQCEIKALVSPEGAGTVDGAGIYDYGQTIRLTVHNNSGYVFDKWEDGNITNPRIIVVEGDASYTALFNAQQFEITTEADPEDGGIVRGAGIYDYGTIASLKAEPNEGYRFISWHDGNATNPRNVVVTQNAHFKAIFYYTGTPLYTVTVEANDPNLGTVTGSGTYPEGASIEISAIPVSGAIFQGWDDGNTDNPRTVVVNSDLNFKAIFTLVETYTITVRPDNPFQGSTYGTGIYPVGTTISIGATPAQGHFFAGWHDGDMNNPRTIVVSGDAEYVAFFSQEPTLTYMVTVYYDETQGFVLGTGTYAAGATATLGAVPADGFEFLKWGDDNTDNPRQILVDHDIFLAVFFNPTGIVEGDLTKLSIFPNPANEQIHIEGLEGENEIQVYSSMGRLVKTAKVNGEEPLTVSDLSAGIYLVRINGQYEIRFVKE